MLPASVVCYRQRQDLPVALARKTSSRMTSVSIMAASNLFIYFYFLFYILKTPHSILSMHTDERSARQNNRFSGSVCGHSLTITIQLIEDFIGPARLLILWLEIFEKKKKFWAKKFFFSFLFLFSWSCLYKMKLCLADFVQPLVYRRVLKIVRI